MSHLPVNRDEVAVETRQPRLDGTSARFVLFRVVVLLAWSDLAIG
jgi:hypothetical protein